MRIFLTSDSYPPLIGGATRATQLLAHELVKRGHTVMVATAWQKNFPSREMDGEVEVARLRDLTSRAGWASSDAHRHTPPPFPDPEATPRLRRLITRFRPDVVHAYGWLAYSAAAALEGLNVPMLLSARDYGNICALRTLVKHGKHAGENCSGPAPAKCMGCATSFYGRPKGVTAVAGVLGGRALLRRRVTGLHSCSTYVETLMMQSLFGDDATLPKAVLPDFRVEGSDTSATLEHEVTARLPKEPFIMFVGALRLIKGIVPLLDAYAQLDAPPPLVLIGTPAPDTPASFPPGVTVIRSVPHATVMAAWERALFGVAPSILAEPLGNVIHEAMSRGKTVIGTTPGGHSDIIHDGENGLLVPSGDVPALRNAMKRLIDDEAFREALGGAALETSQRFTAEAVMPGFERLYERVVAAHLSTLPGSKHGV